MENMEKFSIWVSIILILVVVCILVRGYFMVFDNLRVYSANYEEYADDFNTVKNYIQAQFPDESDKYLDISSYGGIRIYDPDAKDYLQLPNDVLSSLEAICNNGFTHKDAQLDVIRIHEDRISFCIRNGQYALVFSPNEKPSWVNSPDENASVRVKKIGDGWYHIAKKPDG